MAPSAALTPARSLRRFGRLLVWAVALLLSLRLSWLIRRLLAPLAPRVLFCGQALARGGPRILAISARRSIISLPRRGGCGSPAR
jgi:hypothetical protein